MPLPKFQQVRPGGMLGRIEDNMAAYARALTDERTGLLSNGLTISANARGRLFRLRVKVPDAWVKLTLASPWALFGAPQFGANVAARSDDFGNCEARGAIRATSTVTAGARVLDFTTGFAPASDGDRRCVVETLGSAGTVEVLPPGSDMPAGALSYQWGNSSFIDLSGVRWRASAGPVPWPEESQVVLPLGEGFPGPPELIRVEDAVTASGQHLGPLPVWWQAARIGNTPAVRLTRVGGLLPLVTYDLILSILLA